MYIYCKYTVHNGKSKEGKGLKDEETLRQGKRENSLNLANCVLGEKSKNIKN